TAPRRNPRPCGRDLPDVARLQRWCRIDALSSRTRFRASVMEFHSCSLSTTCAAPVPAMSRRLLASLESQPRHDGLRLRVEIHNIHGCFLSLAHGLHKKIMRMTLLIARLDLIRQQQLKHFRVETGVVVEFAFSVGRA